MSSDPIQRFDSLVSSHRFAFVVYYRGHWCPFCRSYLETFTTLTKQIQAAGGIPIAVTAEASTDALSSVRASTGYQGEVIVDPENLLAAELKRRGLLNVAISPKNGYEHGMAQPAVLVLKGSTDSLQKWECVPSASNIGGAKDRPSLQEIWDNVQSLLEGGPVKHQTLSTEGFVKLLWKKIFG